MNRIDILKKHVDLESEKAVIGACLIDSEAITKIFDIIDYRDFYNKRCSITFEALIDNLAKGIPNDVITVTDAITRIGKKIDECGYFLTDCAEIPSSGYVVHHAKIIKEKSKTREYLDTLLAGISTFDETLGVDENITKVQSKLVQITSDTTTSRDIDFRETINRIDTLVENKLLNKTVQVDGYWRYKWVSDNLNDITGGVEPQTFIILGALRKSGKSKWVIDQIVNLTVNQNVPVLFLSLEMGDEKVTRWLWSRVARVDSNKIKIPIDFHGNRLLTDDELNRLQEAKSIIEELNEKLIVDTRVFLNFNQIKSKIYQAKQLIGVQVVFLDYLQRCNIQYDKGQNEARGFEIMSQQLADLAKNEKLAFICLSQLKNLAPGQFARVGDIKHSGGIPDNATGIFIMNNIDLVFANNGDDKPLVNRSIMDVIQRDGMQGRVKFKHRLDIGVYEDEILPDKKETDNLDF